MKLIPLGVGGAFTKKFYHNNYIADYRDDGIDQVILVDCGTNFHSSGDYKGSLENAGYKLTDITAIIITHIHSDHFGGLGLLAQECRWIHNHRPTLIGDIDMLQLIQEKLSDDLAESDGNFNFNDYFEFTIVPDSKHPRILGQLQVDDNASIIFVKTHGLHMATMMSYGLVFVKGNMESSKTIVFSGDIKDLQNSLLRELCDANDGKVETIAILQDTQFISNDPKMPHAYFDDVLEYYPKELHDRLYLMHYGDDIEQHIDKIESNGVKIVKQLEPIVL
jgi:ribonuclease BN (tRNA processing enzyme)